MLNYASLQGNNNKFYHVLLIDDGGIFRVKAEYGRMGATPSVTEKTFDTESKADSEYIKRISSKLKKGYKEVELVTVADTIENELEVATKEDGKNLTESEKKVFKLIADLLGEAKTYVKKNVNMPLGKLSNNQLLKANSLLDSIEKNLHNKNFNSQEAIHWSDEFYALVPVIFNKSSRKELVIDSFDKVNKYRDLLDVMKSIVVSGAVSKVDDVYKNLNMKIKALTPRAKSYKEIQNYVENTQSNNHNFRINIRNIYEVNKKEWKNQFNPNKVNTQLLFHGSRTENYIKILQMGLKIKPAGAVHTGSMFGNGIYFADQSSKSANYCWGFNRRGNKRKVFYMLVCDVAVGKMKDYETAQSYLDKAPNGYDSVRGVKGSSLLHNEIIIYNENQVNIKYIVEFEEL